MYLFRAWLTRAAWFILTPFFLAGKTPSGKKPSSGRASRPVRARPAAKPKRPASKPVGRGKAKPEKPVKGAVGKAARRSPMPEPKSKAAAAPAAPAVPAVKPPPPFGRALLLAPGNFVDTLHPRFRWLSVGGATRYEVAWSEKPDLANQQSIISPATETAVPDEFPLRVGATYYWRVRGGNNGGWGPWSNVGSFQVLEAPPTP